MKEDHFSERQLKVIKVKLYYHLINQLMIFSLWQIHIEPVVE